jgi:hypothetical protein
VTPLLTGQGVNAQNDEGMIQKENNDNDERDGTEGVS